MAMRILRYLEKLAASDSGAQMELIDAKQVYQKIS
jgi:hypothetical protein